MSWPDPGSWTPRSPQKSTTTPSGSVCCTPGQGLAHSPENRRARDAREGARGAGRVVVEVAGGDHGVHGAGGAVAGGVVRERGATAVPGGE